MENFVKTICVFILSICLVSCGSSDTESEKSRTITELQITPSRLNIPQGYVYQYLAIATFNDHSTLNLTNSVDWGSTDQRIASVSEQGKAVFSIAGDVQITARIGDVVSNVASVTVNREVLNRLEIFSEDVGNSIAKGYSRQYRATGKFSDQSSLDLTDQVTWKSSNPAVATISANGLAQFITQGNVIFTAEMNQKTSNPLPITVTAAQLIKMRISSQADELAKGFYQQYQAIGVFSDGSERDISREVGWASSDSNIAKVDAWGGASFLNVGVVTIQASKGNVLSNKSVVTVTPALLMDMIITNSISGNSDVNTISVNQSIKYRVFGIFSDTTTADISHDVSWHSSDTSIATIDLNGQAIGVALGTVMIEVFHADTSPKTLTLKVRL